MSAGTSSLQISDRASLLALEAARVAPIPVTDSLQEAALTPTHTQTTYSHPTQKQTAPQGRLLAGVFDFMSRSKPLTNEEVTALFEDLYDQVLSQSTPAPLTLKLGDKKDTVITALKNLAQAKGTDAEDKKALPSLIQKIQGDQPLTLDDLMLFINSMVSLPTEETPKALLVMYLKLLVSASLYDSLNKDRSEKEPNKNIYTFLGIFPVCLRVFSMFKKELSKKGRDAIDFDKIQLTILRDFSVTRKLVDKESAWAKAIQSYYKALTTLTDPNQRATINTYLISWALQRFDGKAPSDMTPEDFSSGLEMLQPDQSSLIPSRLRPRVSVDQYTPVYPTRKSIPTSASTSLYTDKGALHLVANGSKKSPTHELKMVDGALRSKQGKQFSAITPTSPNGLEPLITSYINTSHEHAFALVHALGLNVDDAWFLIQHAETTNADTGALLLKWMNNDQDTITLLNKLKTGDIANLDIVKTLLRATKETTFKTIDTQADNSSKKRVPLVQELLIHVTRGSDGGGKGGKGSGKGKRF